MKNKKLSTTKKIIILCLIIALCLCVGFISDELIPIDFKGDVKASETDYSDIEQYLHRQASAITDVSSLSFIASNDTDNAVFGGAIRFGVLIYGKNSSGEDEFVMLDDVTVIKNDDIKLIRDYITIIPYDGSQQKTVSIDVQFLSYTQTFTYNVILQEMSNLNTSILVTPYMPVGDSFAPHEIEWVGGRRVSTLAADALQEMFDAAEDAGYDIWVNSGYRDVALQRSLYNSAVAAYGPDQNDTAKPGASEHHTGFAVDLTWPSRGGGISTGQVNDDEYDWLVENCWKYGFILRYTKNYEDVTGYIFEPWHYRYIGKELAKQYHDEGWTTLEEFFCIPR